MQMQSPDLRDAYSDVLFLCQIPDDSQRFFSMSKGGLLRLWLFNVESIPQNNP